MLDQDDALDFYTQKLGFEVNTDPAGRHFRWLTVSPPGQPDHELILLEPGPPMMDEEAAQQLKGLVARGFVGPGAFDVEDCAGVRTAAGARRDVSVRADGALLRDRGDAPRQLGQLVQHDPAQPRTRRRLSAGLGPARDVHDVLRATRPDLVIVDCMLPAALSAAEAAGTPAASLVHFLYGPARREMLLRDSGWTTDVEQLNTTRRDLGLPALTKGLEARERPDLVLVTAPRWLDVDLDGVAGAGMDAVLALGPAVEAATLRIPSNVEVTAWADHDALLPTCAAAITHGGLGTTLRALAHGVPLLLLPLGRDQAFNAARVVEYGAGIQLTPDAGPAAVAGAVARLLDEPGFAAAAARAAARVAADVPDQRAADALEACAVRRSS